MRCIPILTLLLCLNLASQASAQLATRCAVDDVLYTTQSPGRNAWARKCGYITTTKEAFLNSEGEYQVFTNGCFSYPNVPAGSSCVLNLPTSESAPCLAGLSKLGTCLASRPSYSGLAARCFVDDVFTLFTQPYGRNAWARRCGYITTAKEEFLNSEGEYQVFASGCSSYPSVPGSTDCSFNVPYSELAPCIPGIAKLGTCLF